MRHRDTPGTDFLSSNRYRLNVLSGQFAASNVPLNEQSVLPRYRGLPWWGAILLATVLTAIGASIDAAMHGALGTSYQVLYLIGCVGAALAVRRRALFTAAAQPPLVAFAVSIVTLYTVNSDIEMSLRSLVFKLALPIASSFPSMAVTFVLTLAVVAARWYITRDTPPSVPSKPRTPSKKTAKAPAKPSAATTTKSAARGRTAESSERTPTRRRVTAEDERRTQPTRRRSAEVPAQGGRRRADRGDAPVGAPRPEQRTQRASAPRPRPQGEPARDPARAPRPRQPQQAAPTRRTAGAAARAAGVDLTADFVDDPAPRRRPPAPPVH
ncbi:DUF6542 domain-containing protein [Gordonia sp. CPCC 205333]|uniref:DUF6542 domain-containing protein n=1 Tax=Gordonia sp. CPCC 205333 TaxID=3140790 RepID=UPI003AF35BFC